MPLDSILPEKENVFLSLSEKIAFVCEASQNVVDQYNAKAGISTQLDASSI